MKGGTENNKGTFIVRILNRQGCTWQGSLTWVEKQQTKSFRSALELMKMIDGVFDNDDNKGTEGGAYEE